MLDSKDRHARKIAWLSSVKAGDMVGFYGPHTRKAVAVMVDRITPTLIVIGAQRFHKKDGYAIGHHSSFARANIVEITDEIRSQIEHNTLLQWFSSCNWNVMTVAKLSAMKKAHDEAA